MSEVGRELAALVEVLRRVTVQVRAHGAAHGAGVVWDARGLVVTNAHVACAGGATIRFGDGSAVPARVVARDRQRDLAALELEPPPGLVTALVRDPRSVRVGDLVIAVGYPGGGAGAATVGIIHTVERDGPARPPRWIRADVRLAPGFSGGPLADAAGRVIGVNTMIQGGLALAVPASAVERWVRGSWPAAKAGAGAAL